jgi:hypothetical protein
MNHPQASPSLRESARLAWLQNDENLLGQERRIGDRIPFLITSGMKGGIPSAALGQGHDEKAPDERGLKILSKGSC